MHYKFTQKQTTVRYIDETHKKHTSKVYQNMLTQTAESSAIFSVILHNCISQKLNNNSKSILKRNVKIYIYIILKIFHREINGTAINGVYFVSFPV